MLTFGIDESSFHYKYYRALSKSWWGNKERTKTMSLCLYVHYLFFGTLFTVISSPFIVLGWLILKMFRSLYKVMSWTSPGRFVIDFLDNKIKLGKIINELSEDMVDRPALTLLFVFCMFFVLCLLIVGVFTILTTGFKGLWFYWFIILKFLCGLVCAVSFTFFYAFCAIGWVLCKIFLGISTGIKFLVLAFLGHSGILLSFLIAIVLFTVIMIIFVKIMISTEKARTFFGFKINGFHKARESSEIRREQRKRIKENKRVELTVFDKMLNRIGNFIKSIYDFVIGVLFAKTSKKVRGGSVKVLGIFGLLWELMMGLKDGVCPIIEFVNEDDIKDKE